MSNSNRSNLHTFSRVFLMVFIFVSMYILTSIVLGMLLGELFGSIAFIATILAVLSVPAWANGVMTWIDNVSGKGADLIERGVNKIASLFKRNQAATPDVVVEPAAA